MDDFFKHENLREPPALSNERKLLAGTKSSLLGCLPGMPTSGSSPSVQEATVVVLDMPAVIHIVKPTQAHVFGEYTSKHLIPYIESQMTKTTTRVVDAVWDIYKRTSLKSQTRARKNSYTERR